MQCERPSKRPVSLTTRLATLYGDTLHGAQGCGKRVGIQGSSPSGAIGK